MERLYESPFAIFAARVPVRVEDEFALLFVFSHLVDEVFIIPRLLFQAFNL